MLTIVALVFGTCIDAYYLFNATDEGVMFALISLAAAFIVDVLL